VNRSTYLTSVVVHIGVPRVNLGSHVEILSGEHGLLLLHVHAAPLDQSVGSQLQTRRGTTDGQETTDGKSNNRHEVKQQTGSQTTDGKSNNRREVKQQTGSQTTDMKSNNRHEVKQQTGSQTTDMKSNNRREVKQQT